MKKGKRPVKILLTLAGILFCAHTEALAGPVRDSGIWRLGLDSKTGAITTLQARCNLNREWVNLLPASRQAPAAGVAIHDVATGRTFRAGDPQVELTGINWNDSSAEISQRIDLDGETVSLVLSYTFSGIELEWKAVLTGSGQSTRSLRVAFELPL